MTLTLGTEKYIGTGTSLKAAKQNAALQALGDQNMKAFCVEIIHKKFVFSQHKFDNPKNDETSTSRSDGNLGTS